MSTSTPGFQPSPAMGGWPQRSPIKPEHDQEVASFALFTQSFDTLSGDDSSGHPFLRGSPGKAAAAAAHQSSLPQKSVPTASSSSSSHPPRKIQVLVGGRGGPRTDLEMGDISPIKLMEDPQPQPRQQLPYQHPPSSHSSSRGHHHDQGERHRYHHHHHHHGVEGRAGHYQHYYSAEQEQPPPPPPVYYEYHYNGRHDEPPPAARETGRPALPSNSTYNANGYSTSGASNPFFVLRSVRHAFDQCTYKLPCLLSDPHHVGLPVVNLSPYASSIQRYQQDGEHAAASPGEMDLARRRVDSAVHAFGGYYTTVPPPPAAEAARSSSHPSAIFRDRKSEQKEYYDSRFHRRYVVAGNHISWEVESNPPVLLMPSSEHGASRLRDSSLYPGDNPNHHHAGNGGGDEDPDDMLENHDGSVVPMDASQQKMKYRCKLCGQLKQNHNCPYQQSLQRSIAVMVYPAVNAFTACEPGVLTKPLSEMNNFVSYDEASFDPPPPHYNKGTSPDCHGRITHVTPETTTKTTHLLHSPESSLSTRSGQVVHHHDHHHPPHYHQDHPSNINYDDPSPHRAGQKRNHSHVDTSASMAVTTTPPSTDRMAAANSTSRSSPSYFVPSTLGLRPEHYRAVTPRKMDDGSSPSSLVGVDGTSSEEYQYPHVPLTFQERKRLSDTLFFSVQRDSDHDRSCRSALENGPRTKRVGFGNGPNLGAIGCGTILCGRGSLSSRVAAVSFGHWHFLLKDHSFPSL